jgi:hypothetical protein
MYQYDVFVDFFAGSSTVFADVVLGNNFPKSVGVPCFDDASLWLKLAGPLGGCAIAGDKGAERLLKAAAARFKAMAAGEIALPMGKDKAGKETVNWWFTFVFSRAAAMVALHTGDADALEVCRRMAETVAANREKYPEGYASADFAELYAVLWHLTGEEKYKTEGLGKDNGESLKRVTGGMKLPACAHWLLSQPPKKK